MKWIFSLLVLISAVSFAQTEDSTKYIWYKYQYGSRMARFWADSAQHIPYGDTALFAKPQKPGHIMMHTDKEMYRWDSIGWRSIGTVIDTTSLSDRIDLKLNISDTTNKWVQDVYARNDSLFKFKNGTETFIQYGSGSGIDTIQVHTSGTTVVVSTGVNILYIDPASTLATLTITLPATPNHRGVLDIFFGGTLTSGDVVTAITISPNGGQTKLEASTPGYVEAGEYISYQYRVANTKWYRKH